MANIRLDLALPPFNGQIVTFSAPCDCTEVTDGLVINGNTYTIVDAMGDTITGKGGAWCSGALVAVALDTVNKKAYIQNRAVTPESIGAASLDANGKVKAEQACSARNAITANRTINADDAGKLLLCYNANVTITIPTGLPINTEIEICRWSSYTVTIAAASGVTIRSTETARTIKNTYGCVCLKKITADEMWLLTGDLG